MKNPDWAESALRSHPDGIALVSDSFALVFANARYCAIWDISLERALAMTASERFEHQMGLLADPEKDAIRLRLVSKETDATSVNYFKFKDGRWLERITDRHLVAGEQFGHIFQWRDVTDSYTENLAAQHERDLMHSMMDSVPDQIFFKDRNSHFIRINTSLAKRYGLSSPALAVGKSDADFYSAAHAARTRQEEVEIMRTGIPVFNQVHHEVWNDGREAWNSSMKMPLRNASGEIIGTYGLAHDLTEHKKSEALIWKQANFDPLTELPNRRMLRDRWDHALHRHKRNSLGLGLLVLDLDNFKAVNDSLGHAIGDELLVLAARRIERCLRSTDTLARMGGDEFAIILGDLSDSADAGDISDKIVQCFAAPFDLADQLVFVSASVGIALYPENGESIDELLKLADQAMYEAKANGRNGFCFFTNSLQRNAHIRLRMANDLRLALERKQFHLVYQPIVELKTGLIHKAEALIRWNHPEHGLIPPSEFIPLAESIGLIVEICEWVFHTAAQQVREWRTHIDPEIQISVNKSPLQFRCKKGQTQEWTDYLRTLDLTPDAIVVEITEGLLLDATELVQHQLTSLRNLGMQVSLDDFGTGYSSLSYLHRYDIDFLKIDQSFIRDLQADSKILTLCKAIIRMAHELGIKVIAEGIETENQRGLMLDAGCDFGQGYYFSRPVIAAEFSRLISPR